MNVNEKQLPQVADGIAENPPPQVGVEARILGASNERSKGMSAHPDTADLSESLQDIELGTQQLDIAAGNTDPGASAAAEVPGPAPDFKRTNQAQRQKAKARATLEAPATGANGNLGTSASAVVPVPAPQRKKRPSQTQRLKAHKESREKAARAETGKGTKPPPVSKRPQKPRPTNATKVNTTARSPKGNPATDSTPKSHKRARKDRSSTSSQS